VTEISLFQKKRVLPRFIPAQLPLHSTRGRA
jgi:hypothetical protein